MRIKQKRRLLSDLILKRHALKIMWPGFFLVFFFDWQFFSSRIIVMDFKNKKINKNKSCLYSFLPKLLQIETNVVPSSTGI